ncbi:MAG: hypothetical protein JWN61_498 [Pseudonocardiales bacterium]|nr:hypothetical protein [Pseudonocardiales bacterium]
MLTRQNRIGLVLAFLLGLSDIAILGALGGGDDSEKPPVAIVVISVVLGLATLALVVLAWRAPTWALMIAIIILRLLSGLGDLAALGESAAIVIVSMTFLVITAIAVYLLRNWVRKPRPVAVS